MVVLVAGSSARMRVLHIGSVDHSNADLGVVDDTVDQATRVGFGTACCAAQQTDGVHLVSAGWVGVDERDSLDAVDYRTVVAIDDTCKAVVLDETTDEP